MGTGVVYGEELDNTRPWILVYMDITLKTEENLAHYLPLINAPCSISVHSLSEPITICLVLISFFV